MKIKTDFTTNSSSSSFIVLSKQRLGKNGKKVVEVIKELVGVSKLFPNLGEDIGKTFEQSMCEIEVSAYLSEHTGVERLDDVDENDGIFVTTIKDNISEYPFLHEGSFSNDNGGLEELLCDVDIDYKDENFVIYKEGGF